MGPWRRGTVAFMFRTLAPIVAGVIVCASTTEAHAQIRAATAPRLAPVSVSPELRARLPQKRKFEPSKMEVVYRGDTPVLRVKSGRSYPLTPTTEAIPAVTVTPAVVPEIEKRKADIMAARPGIRAVRAGIAATSHVSSQTSVKDQGPRGTCTAFANVAGMEAWVRRNQSVSLDLSENHAFQLFLAVGGGTCSPNSGLGLLSMLALRTAGVCAESLFPYSSTCPPSVPAACTNASDRLRITSLYPLSFPNMPNTPQLNALNTATLEALIDGGLDISYSIKVAGNDWSDSTAETGTIDVQTDSSGNAAGSVGNHQILLVGYNRPAGYFIFKNSWGTDWGHSGYGHVSYDYVETYGRYGFAIGGVGP